MVKLGFIGLGIMGKPMASHLLDAGYTMHIFDLEPKLVQELALIHATACSSSKEVSQESDIIFVMVPDTPDVESVLFGNKGVSEGIRPGSIVVDMSSISPTATKEFAKTLGALGVKMLDAPVSGGQVGAEKASLSIMVGGDKDIFRQIKPYLQIMGKNVVYIGGNGCGQTCKVANQIVVALTIEAISEALLLSSKAGVDPEKVREALLGGFAQSRILDEHGKRIIMRNFDPGFRISLHQKDLDLALHEARHLGLSMPGVSIAQQLFNAVIAHGGKDLDHSAMVLALEELAKHKIGG